MSETARFPSPPGGTAAARTRTARLGLVLGLALFFIVLLLPGASGLTPPARRTAAVAALMAAWWMTEALPIAATSLLPLVLLPALGVASGRTVAGSYANSYVFLFLGGFMLALALERWNLHRRFALLILSRAGTRPARVVAAFMGTTALLSMWVSNTATVLMMLPIAVAVVERMASGTTRGGAGGREAEEAAARSFGTALLIGLAYAASIGGLGTLIGTPPNIVLAGAVRELFPEAPEIGFLRWMALGVPLVACFLPLAWLVVMRLGPPEPLAAFAFGDARGAIRDELRSLGRPGPAERRVLAVFAATVLLWVTRSPGWGTLLPFARGIDDATVVLATSLLLFLITVPERPGGARVPLLDWGTVQRGVPWGVLLLFGGGFALAAAFQGSGLALWLGQRLEGLAGLALPLIVLGVALGVTFLTELTSNTATATLLMPVLASTAVALGVHPFLLMIPAALSASCAFMLPVATPPNAIIFGTPWITVPRMVRTGFALNLIGAVLITLFTLGPLRLVFGLAATALPEWGRALVP